MEGSGGTYLNKNLPYFFTKAQLELNLNNRYCLGRIVVRLRGGRRTSFVSRS